jgi:hypothetical protein
LQEVLEEKRGPGEVELRELVRRLLDVDASIYLVGAIDTRGDSLFHSFNESAPAEIVSSLTEVLREKSFVPALANAIFDEQAKYMGRLGYILVSRERMKTMFFPMRTRNIVVAFVLAPDISINDFVAKLRRELARYDARGGQYA